MGEWIYRQQIKVPSIHFSNDDFKNQIDAIESIDNVVVVTDPPFNIGYHYNEYKDSMKDNEYYNMLINLVDKFPCVFIHYPEALHRISMESGVVPSRICSWVYNSNTARQHRDVAWYNVTPNFDNTRQQYKNLKDKRIQERIARGIRGGGCTIGGMLTKLKMLAKKRPSILVKCL